MMTVLAANPTGTAAAPRIERIAFADLGGAEHGWLSARHHFSFAEYHDPARMGVGPLRVWNDDTIQPDSGFPMHPHRDMEIITYVREGAITHEDHLGNRGRTEAGDVQVMSAGRGIRHSEWNHETTPTTLFQIWIVPSARGLTPGWAQRRFPREERQGRLVALASGRPQDAGGEALPIHQDAALLGGTLAPGERLDQPLGAARQGYLVVSRGGLAVNGVDLATRDAAHLVGLDMLSITAGPDGAELLLADLP